jgi:hypothetical protein
MLAILAVLLGDCYPYFPRSIGDYEGLLGRQRARERLGLPAVHAQSGGWRECYHKH